MSRATKEWIGDSDDQRAPARVRVRIFDRAGGKCHICSQPIVGKKWALDHVKALINGGENRELNLQPVHVACHAAKTREDVAEKAAVAAKRKKHLNIIDNPKPLQGAPMPTSRKAFERKQKAATKTALPPRSLFAPAGTVWQPGEARDHE